MNKGNEFLYPSKRFGSIPGIDVGHQFYSRAEMVILGFHGHWLNGLNIWWSNSVLFSLSLVIFCNIDLNFVLFSLSHSAEILVHSNDNSVVEYFFHGFFCKSFSGYTYCKSIQAVKGVKLPTYVTGCNCNGSCVDSGSCEISSSNAICI